ncbi:antibiotic biosynthesis monooxygenase family protein [Acidicapsa ligni]|uniref:antibiotic biosynthesis monooxygenase family protein n=1 Tax=Acidicapsa ligni TaxID=542300 RepID=UPI0021E0A171|nr:antibiotic biosynthesis monooxygenase [Acidicapsa ligni]
MKHATRVLIMGAVFFMMTAVAHAASEVIEVVTFKLKPGVSAQEFTNMDKAVGREHVAKQPGFISRESASGEDGTWLVVVHWRSRQDADASMKSFTSAPSAKPFMDKLQADTMKMIRYDKR